MMYSSSIATASLRIVAFLSELIGSISITRQALHKRVNQKAVTFFEMALALAISYRSRRGGNSGKPKFGFDRIIVEDSTTITLPDHLIEVFKGGKNACCEKAGMKIDAAFDLVNKRFLRFDIHESSKADQGFSLEGANEFGKGDLLLRDKGYFNLPAFREVIANGCSLITLRHSGTILICPKTFQEIDLPTLFRRRKRIDMEVLAGKKEQLPLRMIAFKLPKAVAQERRRKAKKEALRRGKTASAESLRLLDWQIYLTNCDSNAPTFKNVMELYMQRWTIEILFKGFKSHMRIDQVPPHCSEAMLRSLILSALLRITLTFVVALPILEEKAGDRMVSSLKLFSLMEALDCLGESDALEEQWLRESILRHCCYEKRKRKSAPEIFNEMG